MIVMRKCSTPLREYTTFMRVGTKPIFQKPGGVKLLGTILGHKRPATTFDNLIKNTRHKILRMEGGLAFVR